MTSDDLQKQLLQGFQEGFNESESPYLPCEDMYHYTSVDGLLGILQPKQMIFWFSDVNFLNDKREGKEVYRYFEALCKKLKNDNRISDDYYTFLRGLKRNQNKMYFPYCYNEEKLRTVLSTYDAYVLCFSQNKDSLPMWNYYSKSGTYQGYNIEIDVQSFLDDIRKNRSGYNIVSQKVLYNFEDGRLDDLIIQNKKTAATEPEEAKYNILNALEEIRYVYKDDHFTHEKETRIVIFLPRKKPPKKFEKEGHPFEVKFRTSNNYIIPYIECPIPKDCLSSITIGPLIAQQEAKQSLQKFLKSRGYNNVEINCSNVPVRY